jgi:hypothetical protein
LLFLILTWTPTTCAKPDTRFSFAQAQKPSQVSVDAAQNKNKIRNAVVKKLPIFTDHAMNRPKSGYLIAPAGRSPRYCYDIYPGCREFIKCNQRFEWQLSLPSLGVVNVS